jgi:hypothetical protein
MVRAVVAEQVEERHGIECLWAANTGSFPTAVRQQLDGDDWADCCLPQHSL